jgi:hypothetical protein
LASCDPRVDVIRGSLFVLAAVQLLLTAAPGVASVLVAARLGVRRVPVLLGIGLAGSGVAAMLTFWVYYLAPSLGAVCAYFVFFERLPSPSGPGRRCAISAICCASSRCRWRSGRWARLSSSSSASAAALKGAGDGCRRYSVQLTSPLSDNFIPRYYANWSLSAPARADLYEPGWRMSDRPPLQMATSSASAFSAGRRHPARS